MACERAVGRSCTATRPHDGSIRVARTSPGAAAPPEPPCAALTPVLRRWDRNAAESADVYVTNSNHTRRLILDAYGIEAEVVFPPSGLDSQQAQHEVEGLQPGYFLCVSRLLAYKHVDAIVAAFRDLPSKRLVVVGTGPDERRLRGLARPNVEFLPKVSDEQLCWLYSNARALVAASYEDFGLTPVEAATFGVPSLALRYGGYLDTVLEGHTGLFFDVPEPAEIASSLQRFEQRTFDPCAIRQHARRFNGDRFANRLSEMAAVTPRSKA